MFFLRDGVQNLWTERRRISGAETVIPGYPIEEIRSGKSNQENPEKSYEA